MLTGMPRLGAGIAGPASWGFNKFLVARRELAFARPAQPDLPYAQLLRPPQALANGLADVSAVRARIWSCHNWITSRDAQEA